MPVKRNQHSNPSEDIVRLFCLLLFSGREYSTAYLAEHFSCSKQKIGGMVKTLERLYANVAYPQVATIKRGKEHYYQMRKPDGRAPKASISVEELETLAACRDMVRGLIPPSMDQAAGLALGKAASLLENFDDRAEAFTPLTQSRARAGLVDGNLAETINELLRQIKKRSVCRISYQALGRPKPRVHMVIPVAILSYDDGLYLRGWMLHKAAENDFQSKRESLLALQRVKAVAASGRVLSAEDWSRLPPLPELAHFGLADEVEPFQARIRFSGSGAAYVAERRFCNDQNLALEEDGSVLWTGAARSETELLRWVLSFGAEAELLEPADLRRRLKSEIKAIGRKYAGAA